MGNSISSFRYKVFFEKTRTLRPHFEHLQNRVRTLIGAENDKPCRFELRNAIRQLKKKIDKILEMPAEQCPLGERTAINEFRGELRVVLRELVRSRGQTLTEFQVAEFLRIFLNNYSELIILRRIFIIIF